MQLQPLTGGVQFALCDLSFTPRLWLGDQKIVDGDLVIVSTIYSVVTLAWTLETVETVRLAPG